MVTPTGPGTKVPIAEQVRASGPLAGRSCFAVMGRLTSGTVWGTD
jgi:hypothetical protein